MSQPSDVETILRAIIAGKSATDEERAEALEYLDSVMFPDINPGIHPNVKTFRVQGVTTDGDYDAQVGVVYVGDDSNNALVVHVHVSPNDGAVVVQLDTDDDRRHVRVNLHEGVLFDGRPGHPDHRIAQAQEAVRVVQENLDYLARH
jgi:hypothetical protein